MLDKIKFKTTVKPSFLRSFLVKGTLLSVLGILALIITSWPLLFGVKYLVFCLAIPCILLGLYPYKKLYQLVTNPEEIILDKESFTYVTTKGEHITLPIRKIHKLVFFEETKHYGIGLMLDKKSKEFLKNNKAQQKWQKRLGTDLYLPYFSRSSYAAIKDYLNS